MSIDIESIIRKLFTASSGSEFDHPITDELRRETSQPILNGRNVDSCAAVEACASEAYELQGGLRDGAYINPTPENK